MPDIRLSLLGFRIAIRQTPNFKNMDHNLCPCPASSIIWDVEHILFPRLWHYINKLKHAEAALLTGIQKRWTKAASLLEIGKCWEIQSYSSWFLKDQNIIEDVVTRHESSSMQLGLNLNCSHSFYFIKLIVPPHPTPINRIILNTVLWFDTKIPKPTVPKLPRRQAVCWLFSSAGATHPKSELASRK